MPRVKYATTPVPEDEKPVDPKITPAQRNYLLILLEKKDMAGVDQGKLDLVWKSLRISEDPEEYGMSRAKASELIDWCLKRPDKEEVQYQGDNLANRAELPDVPAGRYAVENEEGILRFYSVQRPKQGKWAGWTFVNVWASDEQHPIKGMAAKRQILEKIRYDGIQQAAERFGREIGSCAICGRTLTDPTSISIGIGPVCRGYTGWYA